MFLRSFPNLWQHPRVHFNTHGRGGRLGLPLAADPDLLTPALHLDSSRRRQQSAQSLGKGLQGGISALWFLLTMSAPPGRSGHMGCWHKHAFYTSWTWYPRLSPVNQDPERGLWGAGAAGPARADLPLSFGIGSGSQGLAC